MNTFQLDNIVAASSTDLTSAAPDKVTFETKVDVSDATAVPQEFICPITLQIMTCPVMTRAGVNFERSAIIAWLQKGSGVCPLTRTPLAPKDIVANTALENKISSWCAANNIELGCEMKELDKLCFVGFVPLSEDKHKKLLRRLERRIHESEAAVANRSSRSRSSRQGSTRSRQSSSSGRSERLSGLMVNHQEATERLLNIRSFLPGAKRAAAA